MCNFKDTMKALHCFENTPKNIGNVMESSPPQDYGEKIYWVLNFNLPIGRFSQMKGLKFSLILGGTKDKVCKSLFTYCKSNATFPLTFFCRVAVASRHQKHWSIKCQPLFNFINIFVFIYLKQWNCLTNVLSVIFVI